MVSLWGEEWFCAETREKDDEVIALKEEVVRVGETIRDWFGVEIIEDVWRGKQKVGANVEDKSIA